MYIELIYEKATKIERLLSFFIDILFLKLIKNILVIFTLNVNFTLCFLLYFTIMHTISGQTFGKYVLGLKVVTYNAQNPNFFQSLIRTILYPVSIIILYPIHDKITKTTVVRE